MVFNERAGTNLPYTQYTTHPSLSHSVAPRLGRKNRLLSHDIGGFFMGAQIVR
jgi:hypothetical protein